MGLLNYFSFFQKDKKPKIKDVLKFLDEHSPWENTEYILGLYGAEQDYTLSNPEQVLIPEEILNYLQELGYEGIYLTELSNGGRKQNLALRMLLFMGTEKSIPILLETLGHHDNELSLLAKEVLERLYQTGSKSELLIDNFFKTPTRTAELILALGTNGLEAVLDALTRVTREEKILLLELLGEFRSRETIATLIQYVNDEHEDLRYQAMASLANFTEHDLQEHFYQALRDDYWRVRMEAAKWLGKVRLVSAEAALRELLEDPDKNVRATVSSSLKQISAD